MPDGEKMYIYDAAVKYREDGVPLVVLAGDVRQTTKALEMLDKQLEDIRAITMPEPNQPFRV